MIFWLCLSAPLLFLCNSLILGALTAHYNPSQNAISLLVHGNYGKWQTLNFIVCGLLTLGLAYMLNMNVSTLNNTYLIKLGVLVLGASLVLLGLFPTDPPGQQTLVGQIHGTIFVITVIAQAILQLVFALSNWPSGLSSYLLISGIITALGLPAMVLVPDWRGLIQRIFVAAIMLWVTVGSLILRR